MSVEKTNATILECPIGAKCLLHAAPMGLTDSHRMIFY